MSYQQYIENVKTGKILACSWVKKAVKRHENDLKKSAKDSYPYYFDDTEPLRVIKFASKLKHFEGDFAGKPIILEPWQEFVVAMIYGWKKKSDHTRRFRKAFVFVARKNGKTTLASVLMLYALFAEPGAQVYSIATKRDQAAISFNNVKQFIKANEALSKMVHITYSTIVYHKTASKLEALSSEFDTMDGLNPSFALADEVSAYKTSKLIDVIQSGTMSRKEPILLEITTGNHGIDNVGFYEFERSQKVLDNIFEDDTFFCILYTLDPEDSWKDSKKYIKANPSLSVTVTLEALEKARNEALIAPYKEQEFKIKNLNLFENVNVGWISDKKAIVASRNYEKHKIDKWDLSDIPCVAAIDLSTRLDFTSYTLYWYLKDLNMYAAKHRLYIPEAQIEEKMRRDSMMIKSWISQGYIVATPGEVIDHSYMVKDLVEDTEKYNVLEVAYDPARSQVFTHLAEGKLPDLNIVAVPQQNSTMGPFNVEWEAMIVGERLCDKNPVFRWMLSNATIVIGGTGLIHVDKIDERKSSKRIDAVITSVIAYNRLLEYTRQREAAYEDLDNFSY